VSLCCCAIFWDGWVEDGEAHCREWIVEAASPQLLEIRPRHPQISLDPERPARALYDLLVGFYRVGLDVHLQGPWGERLPGWQHPQRPPLKLRPLYQDPLEADQRQPELDLEVLAQLGSFLPTATRSALRQHLTIRSQVSRTEWVVHHPSGIELVVVLGRKGVRSICFPQLAPPTARGRLVPWDRPRPARTWGEAWIGHSAGSHCRLPQGLAILPDEVALVLGDYTARYQIEDRTTLDQLEVITFGEGQSSLYEAPFWLELAESCGEAKKYQLAVACCEQALLSLPEAASELKRWQDWLDFSAQPIVPEPAKNIPVRPLAELIRRTGATELSEIAEEIRLEVAEAHDDHRQPGRLRERLGPGLRLVYAGVTGAELLEAGVSAHALARLGYSCNPIPPGEIFPDLFTIRSGPHLIWGNLESAGFLLQSDPSRVYRA